MDFSFLTSDNILPWSDLLAGSFARPALAMQQLLRWLHDGWSLVACGAWDGDRLVAQYSVILLPLAVPGCAEPLPVALSINLAVHPDYRGRGLVKQVAQPVYEQAAAHGAGAGVGFSNAEGVRVDRHSKGYGYQVVGRLRSMVVWLRGTKAPPLLPGDYWPELPFAPGADDPGYVRFAITPDRLRHRFACHPFRRYRFAIWQEADHIAGLVIYRPVRVAGVSGAALLAVYGAQQDVLLARWSALLHQERRHFIHVVTTPGSPLCTALRRIGTPVDLPLTRSPYYLTVKPLTPAHPVLLDFQRWDSMGGDIL